MNGTVDPERQFADARRLEPSDSFLLTAHNLGDPEFSPPGTSVVVLETLSDGRMWRGADPASYRALKERFAEGLVRRAGRLYPDLPSSVEVTAVSTPITNLRYTGNVDGAIYGFANTPSANPAFRLEQRGPVQGLWFASAWTRPGAGYELTIASGMRVARAILQEMAELR